MHKTLANMGTSAARIVLAMVLVAIVAVGLDSRGQAAESTSVSLTGIQVRAIEIGFSAYRPHLSSEPVLGRLVEIVDFDISIHTESFGWLIQYVPRTRWIGGGARVEIDKELRVRRVILER